MHPSYRVGSDYLWSSLEDRWHNYQLNRYGRDVAKLARSAVRLAGERQMTMLSGSGRDKPVGLLGLIAHDDDKAWLYFAWTKNNPDPRKTGQRWLLDTSWERGNTGTKFVTPKSLELSIMEQAEALHFAATSLALLIERNREVEVVQDGCGEELATLLLPLAADIDQSSAN